MAKYIDHTQEYVKMIQQMQTDNYHDYIKAVAITEGLSPVDWGLDQWLETDAPLLDDYFTNEVQGVPGTQLYLPRW